MMKTGGVRRGRGPGNEKPAVQGKKISLYPEEITGCVSKDEPVKQQALPGCLL